MEALLSVCKTSMRISTEAYDEEINNLIQSALLDLQLAGVIELENPDELVQQAIITYCKLNFGNPPNYDKLKLSYDEQKAQLQTSYLYGDFSDVE